MNTHNILFFNMKKENTLNYPKSAAMGFFLGTQEQVPRSRGKRAISVQAIEVLLYVGTCCSAPCDVAHVIGSYLTSFKRT